MTKDIAEFVRELRLSYKMFLKKVSTALPGDLLVFEAYDEHDIQLAPNYDEYQYFISVSFDGRKSTKLWSLNTIQRTNNMYVAYIHVNPQLLFMPPNIVKMCLAEEWLEVMLGFEDPDYRRKRRTIGSKLNVLKVYNSLNRRCLWQDTPDDLIEIQRGLRYLLVSRETIDEVLFEMNELKIDSLPELIVGDDASQETRRKFKSIIDELIDTISRMKHVDTSLVSDRVDEVLLAALKD